MNFSPQYSPSFLFPVFLKALYLLVGETTNNKANLRLPIAFGCIFPTLARVFSFFEAC